MFAKSSHKPYIFGTVLLFIHIRSRDFRLLVNGAVGNAAKNIGILINYQSKTDTEAKTPLFDETSSGTQQITLDKFAYTTEAGDISQGAMLRFKAAMKRTSDAAPTTGRVEGLMTVRLETF